MALFKGYTEDDFQNWIAGNEKYSSEPRHLQERAFNNTMFKTKFGDMDDYQDLKSKSYEEREKYYNDFIDRETKSKEFDKLMEETEKSLDTTNSFTPSLEDSGLITKPDFNIEDKVQSVKQVDEAVEKQKSWERTAKQHKEEVDTFLSDKSNKDAVKSYLQDWASKNSSLYKKYVTYADKNGSDIIPEDQIDWEKLSETYLNTLKNYDEEEANRAVLDYFEDTAAKNQTTLEQWGHGFRGMWHSAVGEVVQAYGAAGAILSGDAFEKALDDRNIAYREGKELNAGESAVNGIIKFLDAVVDNEYTRLGDEIIKTGCISEADREEMKRLYGTVYDPSGGSDDAIYKDSNIKYGGLSDQVFNAQFLPETLQSQGFTIATAALSFGSSALVKGVFKGVQAGAKAAKIADTAEKIEKLAQITGKAERGFNLVNPALMGSLESISEGLSSKQAAYNQAMQKVEQTHFDKIMDTVNERFLPVYEKARRELEKQRDMPLSEEEAQMLRQQIENTLFDQVAEEMRPTFEDAQKEADKSATVAGVSKFLMQNAANGAINYSLKSTLMSPSAQNAMANTRLGRFLSRKKYDEVINADGTVTFKSKMGKGMPSSIAAGVKEMSGEFVEEYSTELFSAAAEGGSSHYMDKWLENRYADGEDMSIDDLFFSSGMQAAFNSVLDKATSTDAIKAGIAGAVGSSMGTFGNVQNFNYGALRKGDFKNLNLLGTFYRNPFMESVKNHSREAEQDHMVAQELTDWANNPLNRDRLTAAISTINWEHDMLEHSMDDPLEFRNSEMGKLVNDAFTLEKLKGTKFADNWIKELEDVASMTDDSEKADKYLTMVMDNQHVDPSLKDIGLEALNRIRKNAQKMLDTIDKVKEEKKKLDNFFSTSMTEVPDVAKEAMVYTKMMFDNQRERMSQMEKEISEVYKGMSDNKEGNNLTDGQKNRLAKYKSVSDLNKDIDRLSKLEESLKSAHNKRMEKLDEKKAGLNKELENLRKLQMDDPNINRSITKKEKELASLDKVIFNEKKSFNDKSAEYSVEKKKKQNDLSLFQDSFNGKVVFSADEIMSMDPETRAYMFNHPEKQNDEQKTIINKLIQDLQTKDPEVLKKIEDTGRLSVQSEAAKKEYSKALSDEMDFKLFMEKGQSKSLERRINNIASNIASAKDYDSFKTLLSTMGNRRDLTGMEKSAVLNKTASYNNEYYDRFKNEAQFMSDVEKKSKTEDRDRNMLITDYLVHKGVDFGKLDSSDPVSNEILKTDSDNKYLIENYFADNGYKSDNIEQDLQSYLSVVSDIIKDRKDIDENNRPVRGNPTTAGSVNQTPVNTAQNEPSRPLNPTGNQQQTQPVNLESPRPGNAGIQNNVSNNINFEQLKTVDVLSLISNPSNQDPDSKWYKVANFFNKYHLKEALETGCVTNTSKVMYVAPKDIQASDPAISRSVVAVVTVDKGKSLPFIKSEEDKYYVTSPQGERIQVIPVAFLSDGTSEQRGFVDGDIQEALSSEDGDRIISFTDNEGKKQPYTSKVKSVNSVSTAMNVERNAMDVFVHSFNEGTNYTSSRNEVNAVGDPNRSYLQKLANNPTFRGIVDRFIQKCSIVKDKVREGVIKDTDEETKKLIFNFRKRDNSIAEIPFRDADFTMLKDQNGTNILEYFKQSEVDDGSASEAIHINNTISGMTRVLNGISKLNYLKEDTKTLINEGLGHLPKEDRNRAISDVKTSFFDWFGKYVYNSTELQDLINVGYDPTQDNLYISFRQKSGEDFPGDVRIILDGKGEENVQLYKALQNLLMEKDDRTGEFVPRITKGRKGKTTSLIYPQVDYRDIQTYKNLSDKQDRNETEQNQFNLLGEKISGWMADGLITTDMTRLDSSAREIGTNTQVLELYKPSKPSVQSQDNQVQTVQRANSSNASENTSSNPVSPSAGDTANPISVEDGINVSNSQPTGTHLSKYDEAHQMVEKMVAGSQKIKLTDDEKNYIDENGNLYERTTTVIRSDTDQIQEAIQKSRKFDKSLEDKSDEEVLTHSEKSMKLYSTPSTVIGTAVDELIRESFSWLENLGNIGQKEFNEQWMEFNKKAANKFPVLKNVISGMMRDIVGYGQNHKSLKNRMAEAVGVSPEELHIQATDITLFGELDFKTSDGKTVRKKVAGTLDLLTYDNDGNFYIFDMKTYRSDYGLDEDTIKKYRRQLTIYKKLLKEQYGIEAKKLAVIPIKVAYPKPSDNDSYSSEIEHSLKYKDNATGETKDFFIESGSNNDFSKGVHISGNFEGSRYTNPFSVEGLDVELKVSDADDIQNYSESDTVQENPSVDESVVRRAMEQAQRVRNEREADEDDTQDDSLSNSLSRMFDMEDIPIPDSVQDNYNRCRG